MAGREAGDGLNAHGTAYGFVESHEAFCGQQKNREAIQGRRSTAIETTA